jgi:hypothetical protein
MEPKEVLKVGTCVADLYSQLIRSGIAKEDTLARTYANGRREAICVCYQLLVMSGAGKACLEWLVLVVRKSRIELHVTVQILCGDSHLAGVAKPEEQLVMVFVHKLKPRACVLALELFFRFIERHGFP